MAYALGISLLSAVSTKPSSGVRELVEAVMDSAMSPALGMLRSPITTIQCRSASTYRSWFYHPSDSTFLCAIRQNHGKNGGFDRRIV